MAQTRQVKRLEGLRLIARFWDLRRRVQDGGGSPLVAPVAWQRCSAPIAHLLSHVISSRMQTLKQDVVYAVRTLAKTPGYAAVTILTLALGIGANSAIFSVVNGVLLKPLPYRHPERLVFITSTFPSLGFDRFWVSLPEWAEFKERNRSFRSVGAYREGSVNLGTPER